MSYQQVSVYLKNNIEPYNDWINKIAKHTHTGDAYFKERYSPAFDSMPAVWHRMTPQTKQELMNTIDTMCATAPE
eukprot:4668585-Ditylum_brightwellii.AAC.1